MQDTCQRNTGNFASDIAPRISKHITDFRNTAYTKHPKLHISQFLFIPPFPWDKCLSRHPPKIRLQLSFSPLSLTKIQTALAYHLMGNILPLSNTWLQSCPIPCSQVQCRKSKAKILQSVATSATGEGRKKSQQSLTTSRGVATFSYSKSSSMTIPLQRCYFSLARRYLRTYGTTNSATILSMSFKVFRPPKLLVTHYIIQVKEKL